MTCTWLSKLAPRIKIESTFIHIILLKFGNVTYENFCHIIVNVVHLREISQGGNLLEKYSITSDISAIGLKCMAF